MKGARAIAWLLLASSVAMSLVGHKTAPPVFIAAAAIIYAMTCLWGKP